MPNPFTENKTVQRPLTKYAKEIGWIPVSQEDALTHRHGESGSLFYDVLKEKLISLNPGVIDDQNIEDVIKRIENVRSNIEGNAEVLTWLRGQRSIYLPSEKREINVNVIDFQNLTKNTFHVTEEWQYTNGKYTNRADVIFLINGIPIVIVETKAAHVKEGIEKGVEQIRRYHNETPEMVTRPQLYDVPNLLDFYYGVTWNLDRKSLFNWKDEEEGNFEKKVKRFFDHERILKILHDYIMFFKKDDDIQKIVLRQHQTRAVEKIIQRAHDQQKRRGLIWHAQGAGKTYTMITVAEEIIRRPEFDKPTVIMIVDRNELEAQLFGNLSAYGLEKGKGMEIAESKEHLKDLLESDYRGLIVSMIHKFDKIPANLCTRKNVFVLVDEAHRTTTGDLGNYLFATVPNATFFGFTGTPIDKIAYGKGTFKVFGKDDEKGYLDKYSIAESIKDGTTVPLHYTLAPNEVRVPMDMLEEEFLDQAQTQGISDIEELNKILDKAVKLKTFLKADDRVDKVANFVVKHFRENVEPLGYKAFLVGVDREACAIYKKALDKHLPSEYSEVVYSPAHNDSEELKEHYLTEDEEKKIRKEFIKPGQIPKILIVTEKLLTGFDAPILYCMYLDKPMRDHTLIQAIARVNRPYEDGDGIKKPSGFVVDFVGIFDKLEKALAFDSDIVASVISNIDLLKTRFETLMKEEADQYLQFTIGKIDDKAIERALDVFGDKDKREAFFKFFKELEMLYEIISPDSFLYPYIDNYGKLSYLYNIIQNAFSKRIIVTKELMNKTEELVKKLVTSEGLQRTLSLYTIDDTTLDALKKDDSSDNTKVINLSRSIMNKVEQEADEQPYLIPISERAQSILEYYDDRQLSTRDALSELEKLIAEYNEARKEREEKHFDINTFSIYWTLKKNEIKNADSLAPKINEVFEKFINFKQNAVEMRELKTEMYKILLSVLNKDIGFAKKLTNEILKFRRKKNEK